MYHEYIFYPFFTNSLLKIVKKVEVVEITECFYNRVESKTNVTKKGHVLVEFSLNNNILNDQHLEGTEQDLIS